MRNKHFLAIALSSCFSAGACSSLDSSETEAADAAKASGDASAVDSGRIEGGSTSGQDASVQPVDAAAGTGGADSDSPTGGHHSSSDSSAGGLGAGGWSGSGGAGGDPVRAPDIDDPSDTECPQSLPGPRLVHVTALADGGVAGYCIDATEVTNAHYAEFLSADAPLGEQGAECAWNETYVPAEDWPAPAKGEHPVVHVDWCDAAAYCSWAGKHLCGRIGGGELAYDRDINNDATQSEWYHVCSAGGTIVKYQWPWYDSPSPFATCNIYGDVTSYPGFPAGRGETLAVGSKTSCHGPDDFEPIYDLLGNVGEWVNSCGEEAGYDDPCRHRGEGADGTSPECTGPDRAERTHTDPFIGFRCCADSLRNPDGKLAK